MAGTLYTNLYFAALTILFIIASIIGIEQLGRYCLGILSRHRPYLMERFGRNQKGA
jgi:hypothetical protein